MDRPRVVSVTCRDAEERLPPDEAGAPILESYVPKEKEAASKVAGIKPQAQARSQGQKPAGGLFGPLFSKISSFFSR